MKILVVEDEVFSRKKLQKIMESFGECEAVDNGEDALNVAVSENPPDLILLDIGLPGIDGYEVCERLKADPRTKNIPVLFLSAHTEIDEKTRGFEKGAVDYITKPFHKAEAKARVETHLALKMLREEGLRESEEKYRNLFENLYDVYYRTDDKGIITLLSPSVEKYLGYTPDELIGQNMKYFYVKPQRRKEFLSLLLKDGYVDNFEEQIKRKDNSVIWVSTNAKLLKNEKGKFLGLEGIARDVSERKRMEDEKEKLAGQLLQAQKLETIGTLAGGIAHDFNNVLYPIMGYTEMIMDDVPKESETQKYLERILKATKRARDLVQQILTFSRQSSPEQKPLKIQTIIEETIKLLKSTLPSSIELIQTIDDRCGPIMGNPTQLQQVIMNLCTNAYYAMRESGGVLEVTLLEEEIAPDVQVPKLNLLPGKHLKLTVGDTGHGMSKKVHERIFDPFYTTKPVGEGTGMGLSIVHGIVNSHKGDITVYSEPGKGAVFHVYIPLIGVGAIEAKAVAEETVPKGSEHILLVDDEKEIVQMVQLTLERLGYRVAVRTSSVEALEAFRAKPDEYDLVITDMTMPNMNGGELASRLLEIRADIPVILCTGFSELLHEKKLKEIGIREHVMKPIDRDKISRTIRKVLDEGKEE